MFRKILEWNSSLYLVINLVTILSGASVSTRSKGNLMLMRPWLVSTMFDALWFPHSNIFNAKLYLYLGYLFFGVIDVFLLSRWYWRDTSACQVRVSNLYCLRILIYNKNFRGVLPKTLISSRMNLRVDGRRLITRKKKKRV